MNKDDAGKGDCGNCGRRIRRGESIVERISLPPVHTECRAEQREEFLKVGRPRAEEEEPARAALRELAGKLVALSEEWCGELAAEARLVWLDSLLPLREVGDLVRAISHVAAVCAYVNVWTDAVSGETPRGARAAARMAERYESAAFTVSEYLEHAGALPTAPKGLTSSLFIQARNELVPLLQGKAKEQAALAEAGEEDAVERYVRPAQAAAEVAQAALLGLVDAMRARAPEALQ